MTVTELAHFHTLSGDLTPSLRDLLARAIKVQDEWCAAHLSSISYMTKGPNNRGVACTCYNKNMNLLHISSRSLTSHTVFQQIEDPAVVLLTAHWDTVAQHMEWIGSKENQEAYPEIQEHLDMSKLLFFHVNDAAAFGPEVLTLPNISIVRFSVAKEKKEIFEEATGRLSFGSRWNETKQGGWRIEKDETMTSDESEEFVLISGYVEGEEFRKILGQVEEKIDGLTHRIEKRSYKRVL